MVQPGQGESTPRSALAEATKILRTYGRTQAADLAESKLAAGPPARSIVVVGEVKRGKSALVNALIGEPDASPVDVDVATSAAVQFVPATESRPAGTAELVFPGTARQIPRAELADWVTVTGRRVTDAQIDALPTRAVVPVAGLVPGDPIIIDTPGAGGLEPMHAQLALQSTERACVIVVVCDATSPISAPEMAFIGEAAATVESVIVAVTKTDKNIRRWRPIVDENRRLLREHLRRDIPVIGVSSTLAAAAATMDGAQRQAALEASGLNDLRRAIAARLALGEQLPVADALRTAAEGLRAVHATITQDIKIMQDTATALPDLTAERDRLAELKDQAGQWEHYLSRDLTLARQAAMTHLDEQLEHIRTRWSEQISKHGVKVLRSNPQIFTAQIEAELLAAMTSTCQLFLDRLYAMVEPLFPTSDNWQEIYQLMLGAMAFGELKTGEVAKKTKGLIDPTMLSMGSIGTSALGMVLGIGLWGAPVWIAVNMGYRAMRNGKQNLLNWMRETMGTVKTQVVRMLEASISIARPEIVIRYREHLRTQMEEIQRQLVEAREAAQQDEATKDRNLKRLSTNQRVVTAKLAALENQIATLTTVPDRVAGEAS
ncbi:hypothetical protein G4X40_03645 [Rhodococcus sp. D2-41]|uniref:dynamin family protein n=1 Tax=Speluncibacter jeojiensis TaxID=2710754 RepID=UPI00240ECC4C|nr:dynamin family protein [Rhodococcus sp. D2-41]MDG3009236.1 hypothetical protein [Rhodococcus sp. D2-41]